MRVVWTRQNGWKNWSARILMTGGLGRQACALRAKHFAREKIFSSVEKQVFYGFIIRIHCSLSHQNGWHKTQTANGEKKAVARAAREKKPSVQWTSCALRPEHECVEWLLAGGWQVRHLPSSVLMFYTQTYRVNSTIRYYYILLCGRCTASAPVKYCRMYNIYIFCKYHVYCMGLASPYSNMHRIR